MEAILMRETMHDTNSTKEETRTAATVYVDDLKLMKAIARLKFSEDPVNNAWKEAVKLFNEQNKHLLREAYDKLDKKNSK